MAIPTGLPGRGERGWRRGFCALLRGHIGIDMLSAGSTLGLRAPDCAKESSTLWALFTLRRGCVGANTRPLCVFAQPHWYCYAFRREYAGATRPRLRQRVFDSLDSLHAAAGLRWCVYAPSPGYTERPGRVQFMLGRVGLYSDDSNTHNRPDSSRPAAAARSRVACAERRESRLSLPAQRETRNVSITRCTAGRGSAAARRLSSSSATVRTSSLTFAPMEVMSNGTE